MLTIVDYGLGNIKAFCNVYSMLGVQFMVAKGPRDLAGATRLILPGVGSFDHAMARLTESGMRESLTDLVLARGVPVLGICVGLQMLARGSDEGVLPGLGWIAADVRKFDAGVLGASLRIPHMGWNSIEPKNTGGLYSGLNSASRFYFLHSYYIKCDNVSEELASADYGGSFCCGVGRNNIFGVQFHPEKSHAVGVQLLKNFSEI